MSSEIRKDRSSPCYLGYSIKTTVGFRLKQWFLCLSWTETAVSSSGSPLPEHKANTIHIADISLSVSLMLRSLRKKPVILIQSLTGTSDFNILKSLLQIQPDLHRPYH